MQTAEIWNRFHHGLLGFIQSKVNDRALAEDILQDVFIKIHQNLGKLRDADKLESWIYSITRFTVMDHFRSNTSQKTGTDEIHDLSEEEEHKALDKCLLPFVEELPKESREIVLNVDVNGMSQREYAEENGLSYSGAKSRIQRARQKLKKLFTDCCIVQTDVYGNIVEDSGCVKKCGCE